MSSVPIEIVAEILRRLPVKSLVRFRSVSKPWRALIYSSDFVKSHLNQSLQNNTNRILVLGIGTLDSVDFDSLDATAVKLDSPVRSKLNDDWAEILGSCHGLLCLINREENRIFLWNPSTRRHKKLPAVEIPYGFQYVNYGFGYDRVNDDYKVVRMLQFTGDGDDVIDSEIKVYSSNTNSWRRIQDFPYCFYHKRDNGTLANGALHWVVGRKPESIRNLIAAFDLASEEYHLVPQPDYTENGFHMTVGVIGDRLCVNCNYYPRYFDVWLMNEYGVKGSWIKLLSIAQPYDIRPFSFLKPIAFSKSGVQLLLEMAEGVTSFFWYDLEKKSVKQLEIHGGPKYFTEQYFCIQSLVPLKGGGARDGMTKSQEKKEKRRIRKKIEEAKKLVDGSERLVSFAGSRDLEKAMKVGTRGSVID